MTAPNRNTRWAEILIDELYEGGLESVCISPGSRSTPLTVAAYEHDDLTVFSHLDERSGSYFALGRARRTAEPVGLICTSGTAAANFHPAVVEANQARVPLVVLTADRPPELRDSGANQTIDQEKLYGDAVRWYRDLPEPDTSDRTLRRLRVDAARAVASATDAPAGPVHLNVPFRKPLEPVEVPEDQPTNPDGLGVTGRDGSFVDATDAVLAPSPDAIDELAERVADVDRVLLVAGPADPGLGAGAEARSLASTTGAPLLADPLSDARFGSSRSETGDSVLICGGYDAYVGTEPVASWPEPEVVVRFGASPTSKPLRKYLAGTDAWQVLIDPTTDWREAEFTAAATIRADPPRALEALTSALRERGVDPLAPERVAYRERFASAESEHWSLVDDARDETPFEGAVVPSVLGALPERTSVFASNSMPVRDLDRFAEPDDRSISAFANRGASGIDGILSTALGVASAGEEPLVAIVGDLAFYHDMNGLLAAQRCGVDATIVVVNNDGGGIFHALPIESFDPPFTEAFKTPHGLDFEPTGDLYDLQYDRVASVDALAAACARSVGTDGVDVVECRFDAETSHRTRESLQERLAQRLSERAAD
ncbi:2-succinyl-6-hydroxy-2,4-cyclohexadiene-1-carboxylate synthase [Salinarchaeum sp. Harcht-Bsk1]|uniref:2-succinyl-5-enolpyruvyl-6-hydroxy-3- cyclohexene-1-carboxylic-acid synthase n=1 Tax=Salinarchaeum sp. Harcht-Bsk1 TaxID=1333523 RepID=UPI00034245C3|nr:2-succinyl-5-enolpyruvyl-6-hydroxy-3-cyclohexene-1-carboxylic-acid synthase [Salinarchaeum sp. Harcht-Bsk1]AGN02916.1 2-succinyl-6-hydroxy-2,4-cyclohexadiene-1-carboxylate synthase [Salinarchaeum sp. Harcht-Bsk1]